MNERNVLIGIFGILALLTYLLEVIAGEYSPAIVAGFLLIGSGFSSIIFFYHSYKQGQNPPSLSKSRYLKYNPFVSIIIPAKNEEKVITETIKNIMQIDYKKEDGNPNYEVIVINDGSIDMTPNILSNLKKDYSNLYIHHRLPLIKSNKAIALNSVLSLYAGEILCIFDADAKVKPNFLSKIVPYFMDITVGAVQARKQIINGKDNLLTSAQENELYMAMTLEKQRDKNNSAVCLWGNGMLIRKEALMMVGGWNNNALTEDSDMSTNLHLHNWQVRHCHFAPVYEEAINNWNVFLKQRFRWAEGNIRCCLSYFVQIIHTPMPITKKIDMLSSILAFALPIWLIIDTMFLFSDYMTKTKERNIFLSIIMYIVVALLGGLWINLTSGFKVLEHKEPKNVFISFLNILNNAVYSLHWVPIAVTVVAKILLNYQPSLWYKTDHSKVSVKVKS